MKKVSIRLIIGSIFGLLCCANVYAQQADTMDVADPNLTLWGYAFGDYAFKGNADTVNLGRGGSNQYTRIPMNSSMFQLRRVYLGANYDITSRFTAEFLLAAEDDFNPGSLGNQSNNGDVLLDSKFAPYVKYANVQWKNIWKNTTLVIGQSATPAFPLLSEAIWGYRSIERTVSDIRRTPSFDFGVSLRGTFDNDANFGYNLMVGNGNSAKPENDPYKWFYGDVWAKFLGKRLIIDLYQDYERLDWNPIKDGTVSAFHHDRNMTKIFVAYTVPKFTVGIEAFRNTLMGDVEASTLSKTLYRTTLASAVSVFARGRIY
jgi:hypothetical protein